MTSTANGDIEETAAVTVRGDFIYVSDNMWIRASSIITLSNDGDPAHGVRIGYGSGIFENFQGVTMWQVLDRIREAEGCIK